MKRGPNSHSVTTGHSLPRSAILKGRRNFRRLFEKSSVIRSPSIHFRYRLYDDPTEGFLIGFIAPKKLGKAVTRNRVKRLLREAYRTNQHLLRDLFDPPLYGLHGVFLARTADLTYDETQKEMIPLLEKVRHLLLKKRERIDNRHKNITTSITGAADAAHSGEKNADS